MDYLAASGLEPQLAIPVIVVVVGALLVYVFGFQKSEEPSMEHLAVLQSTSSYKARSVSNTKPKNMSAPSKAKEKPSQNGHVVHDKERNGVANKKKDVVASNKENKPPRTPQIATSSKKVKQEVIRPEDFDSGEWIQAVSRKDKKKQVKKDEPKENPESPKKVQQASKEEAVVAEPERKEESVLKETPQVQVQIQNQTTQTTPKPSPEKKSKKAAKDASTTTASAGPSSQESSPAKQIQPAKQTEDVKEKVPEIVKVNGATEEAKSSSESSPVKKQSISEESPAQNEAKGRVAFDEMGDQNVDAWEEAKSRGNKKRRARKD